MVVKGPKDVISDGTRTVECGMQGSPRRSGGQGDVLAVFLFFTLVYSIQLSVNGLFQNGMDYFRMGVYVCDFFGYMYEVKGFGLRAHTHTHTHTHTHAHTRNPTMF